jgi:hypothetical protein
MGGVSLPNLEGCLAVRSERLRGSGLHHEHIEITEKIALTAQKTHYRDLFGKHTERSPFAGWTQKENALNEPDESGFGGVGSIRQTKVALSQVPIRWNGPNGSVHVDDLSHD